MALSPIGTTTSTSQSAFGLDFQSLLKIILTQLTYQDPLKPMDNFEFVSQLAQFSQLQQSQTLNDQISSLIAAQSANQATSLLGRTVDLTALTSTAAATGVVKAVSFSGAQPTVTVLTPTGESIADVPLSDIMQIR